MDDQILRKETNVWITLIVIIGIYHPRTILRPRKVDPDIILSDFEIAEGCFATNRS